MLRQDPKTHGTGVIISEGHLAAGGRQAHEVARPCFIRIHSWEVSQACEKHKSPVAQFRMPYLYHKSCWAELKEPQTDSGNKFIAKLSLSSTLNIMARREPVLHSGAFLQHHQRQFCHRNNKANRITAHKEVRNWVTCLKTDVHIARSPCIITALFNLTQTCGTLCHHNTLSSTTECVAQGAGRGGETGSKLGPHVHKLPLKPP